MTTTTLETLMVAEMCNIDITRHKLIAMTTTADDLAKSCRDEAVVRFARLWKRLESLPTYDGKATRIFIEQELMHNLDTRIRNLTVELTNARREEEQLLGVCGKRRR